MKLQSTLARVNFAFILISSVAIAYSFGVVAAGIVVYDIYDEMPEIVYVESEKTAESNYPFIDTEDFIFTQGVQSDLCSISEGFSDFNLSTQETFNILAKGSVLSRIEDGDNNAKLNLSVGKNLNEDPNILKYKMSDTISSDFTSEITLTLNPSSSESSSMTSLDVQSGSEWISVGRKQGNEMDKIIIERYDLSKGSLSEEKLVQDLDLITGMYDEVVLRIEKTGDIITASVFSKNAEQIGESVVYQTSVENSTVYFGLSNWGQNAMVNAMFDNFKVECK